VGARGSCVALGCTSPYRRSPIRIPGDHRLSNARPLRSRHVRGAATPASTVAIRAGLGLAPARGSVWHLLVQSALRTDYAGAAVSASGHARVPVSAEGPRAQQASYRNPRQPRAIAPISQPPISALCVCEQYRRTGRRSADYESMPTQQASALHMRPTILHRRGIHLRTHPGAPPSIADTSTSLHPKRRCDHSHPLGSPPLSHAATRNAS